VVLTGEVPDPSRIPSGCRFHPRCGLVMDQCVTQEPPHVGTDLRFSKCFWSEQHPGQAVPLKEVVTDEGLGASDPVLPVAEVTGEVSGGQTADESEEVSA
jgi:peptide/nickel transport system ATP-binding protein